MYATNMDAPNFAVLLREFCHDYSGPRSRAVQQAPHVFEFFVRLHTRVRLNRQQQGVVNAVLAYFVVPDDLLPEEKLGPFGLVDNLYVASYAFRTLRRELPAEELCACWLGEQSVEEVMDVIHKECRSEIGKKAKDALRLAGLS